jgi:hypothetical protein
MQRSRIFADIWRINQYAEIAMYRKYTLHFALLLLAGGAFAQSNTLDLSGRWEFRIDRNDAGAARGWCSERFDERIHLPGSMPENLLGDAPELGTRWTGSLYDSSFYRDPRYEKYRQPGNVKLPFFLTPDRHYVGVAWYRREVSIPKSWAGKFCSSAVPLARMDKLVFRSADTPKADVEVAHFGAAPLQDAQVSWMVCSMDLQSNLSERIVARQLRSSISSYMQSGKFRPAHHVPIADIKEADRAKTYTSGAPDELRMEN